MIAIMLRYLNKKNQSSQSSKELFRSYRVVSRYRFECFKHLGKKLQNGLKKHVKFLSEKPNISLQKIKNFLNRRANIFSSKIYLFANGQNPFSHNSIDCRGFSRYEKIPSAITKSFKCISNIFKNLLLLRHQYSSFDLNGME